MARISTASAVLGPCVALAVGVGLAACSADDPAHRSFRPQVITASGVPYSGNGIAALDPQAVVTRTIKDTSSAPTVHLSGTLTGVPVPAAGTATSSPDPSGSSSGADPDANSGASSSAVPTAAGTFTLDMVFTQFGAVGDLTNGSATSRLLRVEDEVWAAQPSSFWKAAGASGDGKAYGGLYVKVPTADPRYAGFTDDTRIGFLLDRLLQTSATWKKGPVGTVNGSAALELDGTGKDGHKASIWVATDGEPYILRIAPTAGSYRGQIDFTEYGERLAVQAPLPGQVLDNALLVLPSPTPSASASSSASDSRTGGATGTSSPSSSSSTNPPGHTSSPSASASSSPSASPDASATDQRTPGGGGGH
jgi:hypothetical protein